MNERPDPPGLRPIGDLLSAITSPIGTPRYDYPHGKCARCGRVGPLFLRSHKPRFGNRDLPWWVCEFCESDKSNAY